MKRIFWKTSVLLVAATLFGCQRPAPTSTGEAAEKPAEKPSDIPSERLSDDTARFLAGMPGKPGSPFGELEQTPAWQDHRKELDAAWDNTEEKLIHGLEEFQKSDLSGKPFDHADLFYPFSGPDALTATVCFPHSPMYFLVALEPAGTMPKMRQLEKKALPQYLAEVRTTMASELGKSFFVTREMDRQFRGQITDGLVVPISLLLVRTGHTILGMKYVRLDEQGQIVDRPEGKPVEAQHANKGFAMDFRTEADHSTHRLYYFSVNLDDKHLTGNDGFLHYVTAMKAPTTMLKATSYMPHHTNFSIIRDLVVNRSGAIFQDDSGIPYHFFADGDWNVQLYGDYTKPYGSFRWLEQPDLRKAYLSGTVKPLTLRLGYGFGKVTSNLLLAKRVHPPEK